MSVAIQTTNQEEMVTSRGRDGGIAEITTFDTYYARMGRDGIARVFSAPANIMSLEDRLARDFHSTGCRRRRSTRRKGRRRSRRRRSTLK